jgi:hypothetical protein
MIFKNGINAAATIKKKITNEETRKLLLVKKLPKVFKTDNLLKITV